MQLGGAIEQEGVALKLSTLVRTYEDAPYEELVDALEQLSALSCSVRASLVEMVAAFTARSEDWLLDAPQVEDWLSMRLGLSCREAQEICAVAERAAELPLCFEAFRAGTLCWERLTLLSEFVAPADDAAYSRSAATMAVSQLRRMARHKTEISAEALDDAHRKRSLFFSQSPKGNVMCIRGSLPIDDGLLVRKALEIRCDALGPDPDTGTYPIYRQAMADALVEVCSESTSMNSASRAAAVGADRATLVIETTITDLASPNGSGDLDGRVRVCAETLARLSCDARLQSLHIDADGNIKGIGRVSRDIPPWLYRRLRKRDQGCRFPGCERRTWVNGHHIAEWTADEGPTDIDNLILLCGQHHRFLHEGHWHIENDPNGSVDFVRPDGRRFSGAPPPLRDKVIQMFPALRAS